mmetsp:Transcript_20801/g.53653  ORF Transcript_20801/g.53653 Transcript_20801/m.53653 type:complete len:202 (+) Transcript_20801:1518-2123(+)
MYIFTLDLPSAFFLRSSGTNSAGTSTTLLSIPKNSSTSPSYVSGVSMGVTRSTSRSINTRELISHADGKTEPSASLISLFDISNARRASRPFPCTFGMIPHIACKLKRDRATVVTDPTSPLTMESLKQFGISIVITSSSYGTKSTGRPITVTSSYTPLSSRTLSQAGVTLGASASRTTFCCPASLKRCTCDATILTAFTSG